MVPGQTSPGIEEDEMYTIIQAVGQARLREMQEQAARDRLVIAARRARRETAAGAGPRRRRPRFSWWARRATAAGAATCVPADATPDQWASALSVPAAGERADADGRQPVGGRAA
jgi:hypothetical protein